jgi:chromosomal replication initiator protein
MKPTIQDIEWAVCAKSKLPRDRIRGTGRSRRVARLRQIVFYLCRELTNASYPKIAQHFYKDNTTVLSGVRRIQSLIQTNPKVAAYVDECRAALPSMALREASIRENVERLKRGEVSWPRETPIQP